MTGPALPPIGERLRQARMERGMTVRGLARMVDLSASLISQIETGRSSPSVSTLYAITAALDISIEDVFSAGSPRRPVTADDEAAAGKRSAQTASAPTVTEAGAARNAPVPPGGATDATAGVPTGGPGTAGKAGGAVAGAAGVPSGAGAAGNAGVAVGGAGAGAVGGVGAGAAGNAGVAVGGAGAGAAGNAGVAAGADGSAAWQAGVGGAAADAYMVAAAGALAGADRSASSAANQGLRQLQRKRRVGPVVAANEREVLQLDSGVTWELLGQLPDTHVDFLRITYAPGGSSSGAGVLMRHSGTEFGHVLSGQLTLTLGFDTYVLNPGDSVSFDCSTPHSYANHGTEPAMGVWFVAERFR